MTKKVPNAVISKRFFVCAPVWDFSTIAYLCERFFEVIKPKAEPLLITCFWGSNDDSDTAYFFFEFNQTVEIDLEFFLEVSPCYSIRACPDGSYLDAWSAFVQNSTVRSWEVHEFLGPEGGVCSFPPVDTRGVRVWGPGDLNIIKKDQVVPDETVIMDDSMEGFCRRMNSQVGCQVGLFSQAFIDVLEETDWGECTKLNRLETYEEIERFFEEYVELTGCQTDIVFFDRPSARNGLFPRVLNYCYPEEASQNQEDKTEECLRSHLEEFAEGVVRCDVGEEECYRGLKLKSEVD